MKLTFLGTGAGRPNKTRNVTAAALQLPEPACSWWLFDAGEAAQHMLMQLPLKLSKLSVVCVTHLHGDHLYGLPGLLSSRSFDGGVEPLRLFGPKGIRAYIETTFKLTGTVLDYDLIIEELEEGRTGLLYEGDGCNLEAAPLEHRIPCFGYRVIEPDAPGRLLTGKLEALGVPKGPLYGKLKRGETITLQDGTIVRPSDVIDGKLVGRIVTILGDTSPCANAVKLADGADLLVHEATFAAGMEEKARAFGHSTTMDAARTAKEAGARRLIMTHFSGRYSLEDLSGLREEAASLFPSADVATDLAVFEVERCKMG
ncbi:ribonuclease Z [Paenibacillus sp. J5C_2022]|uniref:ribonuclease Z n=1 Tax=Paenibacillus sp. J5C2022 TaxID=2977129 RepID=UPI0021CFDC72|nr:ribonuclease Z [Paenibacillus sp. J5C2022]MCU6708197.1 ribonuclease Z [Paenibacillus sp. J5C2022]